MQSLDLQTLERLLFILIGFVVVTVVALGIYVVIANRRDRARLAQSYEDAKLAPRPALQITGQILSLVREEAGGALHIEIAGSKYHSFAEIEHPQVKRQVVAAAMELIQFTGVLGSEVLKPSPIDKTQSWREDLRDGSHAELAHIHSSPAEEGAQPSPPASKQVQEQFLHLLTEMGATAQPDKPSLVSSIQQRLTPKSVETDQTRTFVDDIEDIIQRRIPLSPALSGRDVHVRSGPAGTVRFVFEGREYENLNEIPNLTARQLIKDAIQEWDETT